MVREVEYACAHMTSRPTAVCNETTVDFDSATVFDLYMKPGGVGRAFATVL